MVQLEDTIREGLRTYKEAWEKTGAALKEINDGKLYRQLGFKTFEAYLKERWGLSRAHGYRLMDAAKGAEMSPMGDKPASIRQALQGRKGKKQPKVEPTKSPPSKTALLTDPNYPIQQFRELMASWEKALSQGDLHRVLREVNELADRRLQEIRIKEAV
jgi:hypothetical protein